jgi:hypothetical protein
MMHSLLRRLPLFALAAAVAAPLLAQPTYKPVATSASAQAAPPSASAAAGPVIQIDDVALFYKVYDAAGGHPTADQLQHDYLDAGSDGLHQLASERRVTGATIAKNLADHPETYTGARKCTAVLPRVRERLQAAMLKLGQLYPEARFPPVTILASRPYVPSPG